ncbi:MAG: hypothetical protein ACOCRK_09015, partial [bacterium]
KGRTYLKGEYYNLNKDKQDSIVTIEGIKIIGRKVFVENITGSIYADSYKQKEYSSEDFDNILGRKINLSTSYYESRWPNIYLSVNAKEELNIEDNEIIKKCEGYYFGTAYGISNLYLSFGGKNQTEKNLKDVFENNKISYQGRIKYRNTNLTSWLEGGISKKSLSNEFDEYSNHYELGVQWNLTKNISTWLERYKEYKDIETKEVQEIIRKELGLSYKFEDINLKSSIRVVKKDSNPLNEKKSQLVLSPSLTYYFDNDIMLSGKADKIWFDNGNIDYKYSIGVGLDFNLPVPGIKDFALLDGITFIDKNRNGVKDPEEPVLKDVVLELNNYKVVSSEKGNYIFPPLEEGEYVLDNKSSIPGYQCSLDLPLEINMSRGDEKQLDIPFIEVTKLSGKVYYDKNKTGELTSNLVGLSNVKVLINSKNKSYTTYTNQQGMYSVILEPGNYNVSIDQKSLPKRFELTTSPEVEIKANTAENIVVNFGAFIKPREISFTYFSN